VELAEAARLGALVAEGGPDAEHLDRLGAGVHAVLEVGADHTGGELWAQGEFGAALVLEGVHLLLDDVGALTDAADEEGGLLEEGDVEALEAVTAADVGGGAADELPVGLVLGQDVLRAPGRSIHVGAFQK